MPPCAPAASSSAREPGIVLAGKTLGLVGLGRIGALMARYGRALGMKVLAWSPNLTDERAAAAGAQRVDKGRAASPQPTSSACISCCPPRTRGIARRRRPRADEARRDPGQHVARAARRRGGAGRRRAVAGASSPRSTCSIASRCRPDHPLTRAPNIVLTPHLGYSVRRGVRASTTRTAVENALAFLDGKPIRVLDSRHVSGTR